MFWRHVTTGLSSEDVAVAVGVPPPVGTRWFRHGGGMPTSSLVEPGGRYLSFPEREDPEITLSDVAAAGAGDCLQMRLACPPTVVLADLVSSLKGVSARVLKRDRAEEMAPLLSGMAGRTGP